MRRQHSENRQIHFPRGQDFEYLREAPRDLRDLHAIPYGVLPESETDYGSTQTDF